MTVRVGINGFGRIGRNFFRASKQSGADIDFVAVNDLGSVATMAHLLKYDSVLGQLPYEITATDDGISVDGDILKVLSARFPNAILHFLRARRPAPPTEHVGAILDSS